MSLSPSVLTALEAQVQTCGLANVRKAWENIYESYQDFHQQDSANIKPLNDTTKVVAYAATRMISTHGVLEKIMELIPSDAQISSLLDLGAGTGAGAFASLNLFPDIKELHLVDQSKAMLAMAQTLLKDSDAKVQLHVQNMTDLKELTPCDLVIISYALHEMEPEAQRTLLEKAWGLTKQYLVIAEPGTPYAFKHFVKNRSYLIKNGATVVAPCSHENLCPLGDSQKDWCHFSVRLARPYFYQQIKGGSKSYGDEKYTFGIFKKGAPLKTLGDPIIAHPRKSGGLMQLNICTAEGIKEIKITRKDKDAFKAARHLEWGDFWRSNDILD